MLLNWIAIFACFKVLFFSTEAAVANVRVMSPNMWGQNRYMYGQNYPQFQYASPNGENQLNQPNLQQMAQLQALRSQQHTNPYYEQYLTSNGMPQSGFMVTNRQSDPRTYMIASSPVQDFNTQTAVTAEIDGGDISSHKPASMISPTSGSTIVGAPSDGVIGADGQVLGSAQDTAVVESAGQLGPTLMRAQIPVSYQGDPTLAYPQQHSQYAQQILPYQYAYQTPDRSAVYQVAVDQYGQPVTNQDMQQNPQLFSALYPTTV